MSEKGVEEKNPSSTNDSMLARIVAGIISILMLCVFFWIISSSNESLLTAVTGSHPRSFDLNFGPGILNTLLMTVVLILVFSVLLPYLACNYGKKNNTKVFDFFDKRWLPEKGKSKVVTKYNERLEMVAVSEYWSTTVWSMVTEKIPITLFLSLILTILGILPIIVRAGSVDSLVVTFFLSFYAVLVFMITLITFWVTEWKRTRDKVVVFTTFFIKTTVRTNFLHLLVKRSLASYQRTEMINVSEPKNARDAQDLGTGLKTSWFRDLFTSKNKDTVSIYIPSHRENSSDILLYMDNGYALLSLLVKLQMNSLEIAEQQKYITDKSMGLRFGDPNDKSWTPAKGEQASQEYMSRFENQKTGKDYDYFWVTQEDVDVIVVDNDIYSDINKEITDVSNYFPKINPLRR